MLTGWLGASLERSLSFSVVIRIPADVQVPTLQGNCCHEKRTAIEAAGMLGRPVTQSPKILSQPSSLTAEQNG
jgi:hypothetical protein